MKAHDIADTRAEQPATESDAGHRLEAGGGIRRGLSCMPAGSVAG
jgi:hypothetical protein